MIWTKLAKTGRVLSLYRRTQTLYPELLPFSKLFTTKSPQDGSRDGSSSAKVKSDDALKCDHREIGKQQKLFMINPMAPGSIFMLPHGTRISNRLMEFVRAEYRKGGYEEVVTPLLFNKDLWVQSGHWENYKEDMFLVSGGDDVLNSKAAEGESDGCGHDHGETKEIHGLKPMNCPGHCLTFKNQSWSYRDLPIRMAEFSPLHRNEASGALTGLTRVRKFHQDDAHIFCTPSQILTEIAATLAFIDRVYKALKFPSYSLALSTRPEKSIGTEAQWAHAEKSLLEALQASGRPFDVKPGDGAFYGPKIDVMVRDAMGRSHQTATVQLDFQLPVRFDLQYTGEDGKAHVPVMVHRAALGSIERIMGVLIEHYVGQWPFWLSPRQAVVIPATNDARVLKYAQIVAKSLAVGGRGWDLQKVKQALDMSGSVQDALEFSEDGQRYYYVDARTHDADMTLGKRVRDAWVSKYTHLLIVGEREVASGTVSLRTVDSVGKAARTRTLTIPELVSFWEGLCRDYE
ncbi:54S ribosomal protein L39, mitochondrial [Blyttiomyces sp. JEL0837]|nr:54S ribosomal protein L39, mitochondrial [Blyttiomyces sp. JEL0837]